MTSASYALPASLARSYLPDGTPVPPQRYPLAAAGGLVADAGDLARFAAFLLDGRADDGRALLSPASLQRMERAETTLAARAGVPHGYGLGNAGFVGESAVYRGHGGAIDAYAAELRYDRGCGCGFVVLVNGGRVPAGAIALLETHLRAPAAAPAATVSPDAAVSVDLAAFAGIYQPIAQRNRLLGPVDAMTTFAKGAPTGDGRFAFDGVVRDVDARGHLRRPDRAAPTAALWRDDTRTLVVGPLANWQRVPGWSVVAKATWVAALVLALLSALVLAFVAHRRRRPAGLAWATLAAVLPLPLLLGLFVVAAGLPAARSIATFAAPTPLSVGVMLATLLLPAAAAWLGWRAWRSGAAGPAIRTVAAAMAVLLAIAAVWLAGWGWLGLRTWAL
jgi:hypothetical protein